ncbi:MAG: NUDIX domain-containing protein, partial [Candidatus Thermoplasmatota archaeon]|nr:NUDIX domain-containing protein [Candidatus Thermoplasmatota archaeon]
MKSWVMVSLLCDLGVAARVVRNGQILLVQEASGPHQGKWGFPKGRVDPGESPEAAALRELFEESGHDGRVMGLAGVRTALRKGQPAVFLC